MNSLGLYFATVMIWGSTWIAIKLQLGVVTPEASVAYRFAIAAVLLIFWALVRGKDMRYAARDHVWMAALGFFLFSSNYYVFYVASGLLTSGLVAVAFSTIVPMNIIFAALFFRIPATRRVVAGAMLGLGGLLLVFRPEIETFDLNDDGAYGLALCLFATMLASLGNMVATRNQRRGLPVLQSNAYGMMYGAIFTFGFAALGGGGFAFDPSIKYVGSLLYLAVFGSVIAFGCYLTLLGRIGAGRASYAAVLFPVVALSISVVAEDYTFSPDALIGAVLVLLGNVLMLARIEHGKNLLAFVFRRQKNSTP